MSWYKTPLQPFDPIIKDPSAIPPEGSIRYLRDNFDATGQDSNTAPTSQDQSLWQALTNIQPISKSQLERRWGYTLVSSNLNANPVTRLYSLQNNISLQRFIIYTGVGFVASSSEPVLGVFQSWNSPITTIGPVAPRMVDSRNYGYIYDGTQADLLKFQASLTGQGVTNWGIQGPSVASSTNSVAGLANVGSSATVSGSGNAWVNPTRILTANLSYATTTSTPTTGNSQRISVSGYGFAVPAGAIIQGISVGVLGYKTQTGVTASSPTWAVSLLKAGVNYGDTRYTTVPSGPPSGNPVLGGPTDLWGTSSSWTPADINAAGFGVQIQASATVTTGVVNYSADFVQILVYYTTVSGKIGVAVGGAGLINLTVGRTYYAVYQNSITGHISDLSVASNSSGPVVNSVINLSTIPISLDAQVDSVIILATADGGDPSILYFVASVPNGQTTYTDNTPETTLLLNQQYLFTDPYGNEFGVTFNDPPPNGIVCIKHKGRLWMAQQQNLFFSKAIAELTLPNGFIAGKYEESWPPQNYFDISAGAETISGLFSDGNVIYIGTQNHIRRIFGDSPTNFQQPEICHQDVGVLNQEVWQNVFLEGTPTGFMWLTPDFKVMGSDGNTYLDVGHQIQDVLNSINPLAAQNCHAMFVQQGPYDLYILAIPTGSNIFCDTHCVFDMRSQRWLIWQPFDQSTAMLFNVNAAGQPQWLFAAQILGGGIDYLYQYNSGATTDRSNTSLVPITATAITSWLHLGSPSSRKVLDEIEIVGDPNMTFSLDGASTQADFNPLTPNQIVLDAPLTLSPFQTYKVYLAGKVTKYHYYQLEFESSSTTSVALLNAYSLRVTPWNSL